MANGLVGSMEGSLIGGPGLEELPESLSYNLKIIGLVPPRIHGQSS